MVISYYIKISEGGVYAEHNQECAQHVEDGPIERKEQGNAGPQICCLNRVIFESELWLLADDSTTAFAIVIN